MRLRRRLPRPDPAVVRATADALTDAELTLARAEAAHRSAYAVALTPYADVPRSERPPEDLRTALARTAAAEEHSLVLLSRVKVEQARRDYHAAVREGAR